MREIYWIEYYNSFYDGYNETKGGDGTAGEGEKSVKQYDMLGNFIAEYESITMARIETNINGIGAVCNGKHRTAGGYQWKFSDDEKEISIAKNPEDYCKIPVLQYDLNGNFIQEFESISEASKMTSSHPSRIIKNCKKECLHANGFQWKYKTDNKKILPVDSDVILLHRRKVAQYDRNGNFLNVYSSILEAERQNNIKEKTSNITRACKGRAYESNNYQWRYVDDINDLSYKENIGVSPLKEKYSQGGKIGSTKRNQKVAKCDLKSHEILEIFNSMTEASEKTKICLSTISQVCNDKKKSAGGYYWIKYIEQD